METKPILDLLGTFNSQGDAALDQIEFDMGEMLLPLFVQALAYQSGLENSVIIYQMMYWIVKVVNDLEALKNGTAEDQDAFKSPACQSILNYFTVPQEPGLESLYDAASQSDNNETANIIYCMEYEGTFNTKSGLLGQIRIFLAQFCSRQPGFSN